MKRKKKKQKKPWTLPSPPYHPNPNQSTTMMTFPPNNHTHSPTTHNPTPNLLNSNPKLCNHTVKLISQSVELKHMKYARYLFIRSSVYPDFVIFNVMFKGYSHNGDHKEVISLFRNSMEFHIRLYSKWRYGSCSNALWHNATYAYNGMEYYIKWVCEYWTYWGLQKFVWSEEKYFS